jgi:hypothetical protein
VQTWGEGPLVDSMALVAPEQDNVMPTVAVCRGLVGFAMSCAILCAQEVTTPREAAPVIAMLKAAKDSDVAGFRNAYSRDIREDKDQGDWEKNLKEAQVNMTKLFGNYRLDDFRFAFAGDSEKGKVTLSHKGREAFPLNVIKEGNTWKVDER